MKRLIAGASLSLVLFAGNSIALASLQAPAGPYRVEVAAEPPTIPVDAAKLLIRVTDTTGRPVEGAQVSAIAQMPGMPMGEREETAVSVTGQPGVYSVPARFAMEGAYQATIRITGAQGTATAQIPLKTGQNTGALSTAPGGKEAGGSLWSVLVWIIGIAFVLFTLYRMARTGQRPDLRGLLNPRVLAGIAILVVVYLVSTWAVKTFIKPGHMSVIEAQAMDMTVMKPPVGAVPVAAMAVRREPIDATVSYTGSAVSFVDQEVTPRVTGTIVWMPFYAGNRVRQGQVVARLDTSELGFRTNEQVANVAMAEHANQIARMQAQQARNTAAQAGAQVGEARSDVESMRGDLASAQQEASAARDERAGAQADLEGAQTAVEDAQAQLTAARADQTYWSAQIQRSEALVKSGAISQQEYQQDRSQAENADAKVHQAQAHIQQADAGVRSAQSRLKKADAMIASAQAKVQGAEAKVRAGQSKVAEAQDNALALAAAAAAAAHEIPHTKAGMRQAEAQLNAARVVEGYTEIRADVDGVITQRLLSPGQLVQPGQAILRISQISPIRLQVNVAQDDLPNIRVGNRVRVRANRDPRHPITARVTSVFPAADPVARTSIVEAVVPNADRRILPGDFLTMDISTGENRNALVVPSGAIVWQPQATSPVLATEQQPAAWVIQAGTPEKTVYTCTMHPEVKQDKPGKCPT